MNPSHVHLQIGVLLMLALISSQCIASNNVQTMPMEGEWIVNVAETDLLREDLDEKTQLIQSPGKMQISVMGIPLPGGGGTQKRGQSPLTAKEPSVLLCQSMVLKAQRERIELSYPDLSGIEAKETLRKGHFRGRDTKWSTRKIEQKYKTTERKVSKSWSIRPDGRLLVVVTIKASGSKKRTYRRVFDRVPS